VGENQDVAKTTYTAPAERGFRNGWAVPDL